MTLTATSLIEMLSASTTSTTADPALLAAIGAGAIVLAALVGAGSALAASLFTGKSERQRLVATHKHERDMHREDIRREAYANFLDALDGFSQLAFAINAAIIRSGQDQVGAPSLEERIGLLDRANHRVQLVGSEPARVTAREIIYHTANEVRPQATRAQAQDEFQTSFARLRELQRTFESQARVDVQGEAVVPQ